MSEFIKRNFSELLLTFVIFLASVVLIFAIHWHADQTVTWAQGLISGIVVGLAAVLNSVKQPAQQAENTTVTSTVQGNRPKGDQ